MSSKTSYLRDAEGEGERKPLWLYGGLVCVRCKTSTQD
jgi:hypothetical protein